MTLAAFFLGLAIGIGFWLWRRAGLYRQMQKMLAALQTGGAEGTSLPIASRLRLGVVLANEYRQQLEMEIDTWHQMLEAAPMGYLHVDEENQLLWCNNQARQLLQIQRWEPGQVRLLLEVVRSYELDQLIERTRRHQQPNQIEWLFHPAIASSTPIQDITPQNLLRRTVALTLRASSLPLAQGQVGVFLENRQPFIEISESRDRWVSDLAHELRTPLTSISLVAEALEGRLQPPERRWVEQLSQETNRLINLVQDLLEISHLERDPTQYLKLKPVQLPSLIQTVWQNLEPLARKKQLSLAYSGPGELEIQADESRLTQVFLNLFDNSIKYSSEAGTICVEINLLLCEDASSQVQINIIDLGSGFPEPDLPRVFERLYRGDPSRQRQQQSPISKGSGLGLAIVQQIILAHGGSIQAKNHPETGGAWLQIHLPITNS